ncbi:GATA zinc finger domain-containing protein 15-like [Mytilus edulis]|uniref:GATA zinc finger domain-containing protein 15-like n=1 Tax=Mytilus edulis TaxID=6550 RepID=UPI0039F13B58
MNNDLKQVHRSESEKENFKETRNNKTGGSLNHNDNETSKNRNSQDEMKYHVHIIGSSIVKELVPNRIYRNTRVTTLNDKTIEGALDFANSGKLQGKHIVYQIGSNESDEKKSDEVLEEIEALIDATNNVLKNPSITIGEVLPRFYHNSEKSKCFKEKMQMYNILLKDYCKEKGIDVIRYNMHFSNMYDGIHLNKSGINQFVRCMNEVMNPILGIVYADKTDTNIRKNTPVYSKNVGQQQFGYNDSKDQQRSGYKENRGQYNENRGQYNENRGQYNTGYNNNNNNNNRGQ